jgi:hypothetical protein
MLRSLLILLLVVAPFGAAPFSIAPFSIAPAPVSDGHWSWPVHASHRIVRPFIAPATPYSAGHRGIDIAATGDAYAPADGVVHFSGFVVNRDVLSISHAGGVLSSYEPVLSPLHAGDLITRGEDIGMIEPGHCSILCLHFGVRIDGQYVSPLLFLGGIQHSVLLPTRHLGGRVAPSAGGRVSRPSPEETSSARVGVAVALLEPLGRDVGVQLRSPEACVSQHLLHRSQVCPTVKEVRCRGVPQRVRTGRA